MCCTMELQAPYYDVYYIEHYTTLLHYTIQLGWNVLQYTYSHLLTSFSC
jgi:hypothetical protein